MATVILAVGALLCAIQAMRVQRLLPAALWLAAASAFTAMLLYAAGLHEAAVVELSVGSGLVFILLIYAISLSGDARRQGAPIVPRSAALVLVGLALMLVGMFVWPTPVDLGRVSAGLLSTSLWMDRQLDVVVQIVLIFSGALTIAGLLARPKAAAPANEVEGAAINPSEPTLVTPSDTSTRLPAPADQVAGCDGVKP